MIVCLINLQILVYQKFVNISAFYVWKFYGSVHQGKSNGK
jgi:hypothetical protein